MYANVEEEHNFLNITKDYTTKCHKRHEKLRNITMHQKKPPTRNDFWRWRDICNYVVHLLYKAKDVKQ